MKRPKKNIRLIIHIDDAMASLLKERSLITGSTIGELVRTAIRFTMFADTQTKIERR